MKKKKLKLNELDVQSFVTSFEESNQGTIKGGGSVVVVNCGNSVIGVCVDASGHGGCSVQFPCGPVPPFLTRQVLACTEQVQTCVNVPSVNAPCEGSLPIVCP